MPRRIAMPIFNRATYARCKTFIEKIARNKNYELEVGLSSGLLYEEFGNAQTYIKNSNSHIKFINLDIGVYEEGILHSCAEILRKVGEWIHAGNFDTAIVVADRYETLPAAYAAVLLNVPVCHIQGGEVTGNIDERVRHGVTKLSDFHLVSTSLAKEYVIEMGEQQARVKNTGCPSIDLIKKNYIKRWKPKQKYILCIFHPDTEVKEDAYEQTKTVLLSVIDYCERWGSKCYWFYPNPDPGRDRIKALLDERIKDCKLIEPYVNEEPESFLYRLAGCEFIIGNSSCGFRETSFLGIPSINIGDRQRARERSWNVIDCEFDFEEIRAAMDHQRMLRSYKKSHLYGDGDAAERMVMALDRWDFSLKESLQYPYLWKFKGRHFSEKRFKEHEKWRPKKRKVNTE